MNKFIPISQPSITKKEVDYVTDAVKSTWVSSLGEYINKFEKVFAKFCNTKYALTTSTGTTALHLALVSLGIGEGDEVIVPDFTFIATANAVTYTGAKAVLVDIEADTLCILPDAIEMAITDKTKAIIPVHIYGHPADMEAINRIAQEHDLYVVEDAAEAHGAEIKGNRVGGLSDVGIFSFYGNKIMTSGEGGMIVTNNKNLYDKMSLLRDHGMSRERKYWHTEIGFNYRMTNMQAALGLAQFERINDFLEKRNQVFEWYKFELGNTRKVKLNTTRMGYKSACWLVCAEISGISEIYRDELIGKLRKRGIDSRPYFYPISDMPMYGNVETKNTHDMYKIGLNLPNYFDLEKEDVIRICSEFKRII